MLGYMLFAGLWAVGWAVCCMLDSGLWAGLYAVCWTLDSGLWAVLWTVCWAVCCMLGCVLRVEDCVLSCELYAGLLWVCCMLDCTVGVLYAGLYCGCAVYCSSIPLCVKMWDKHFQSTALPSLLRRDLLWRDKHSQESTFPLQSTSLLSLLLCCNPTGPSSNLSHFLVFSISTSNFSIRTSNFSIRTSNFSIRTSNFSIRTSNFSIRTSNFSIRTSNFSSISQQPTFPFFFGP